MTHIRLRSLLAVAASAALLGAGLTTQGSAQQKVAPVYAGIVKGVAVGGYDPVAYFTDGQAVKGREDITLQHQGATWRFASAQSRDRFKLDPAKYAPQFGGYCAWAVAEGYTAKGDPEAWTVHDGKLYLNYNKKVQANWEKNIPGNVQRGDANWPRLALPST